MEPRRPSSSLVIVCLALLVAASLVLGLASASALAAPPALLGDLGFSGIPRGVAVEESTGNVFVAADLDPGVVDVFGEAGGSPAGLPATLTGEHTPAGTFEFGGFWAGVAVDNSTGAAARSIYVADIGEESPGHAVVDRFKASGSEFKYESRLTGEPTHFKEPQGVASDADGDVYVTQDGGGAVREFSPAGTEIAGFATAGVIRSVAVDSRGDVFMPRSVNGPGENVVELERGSDTSTTVAASTEIPDTESVDAVAVDRATNTLYLASPGRVAEYSLATGTPVKGEEFGEGSLEKAGGLAVNEKTGRIYVADEGKQQVFIYQAALQHFPLTVFITGEGEVTSTPAGIKCSSEECTHAFAGEVTLTETPKAGAGYEFAGWLGCRKASATNCTVDVSAVSEVTAVFLKAGKEGVAGKEGSAGEEGKPGAPGPAGEKGPAGPPGVSGPAGPPGVRGPAGPAGKIELVTCKNIKGKQHCTAKLVPGTVMLTIAGSATRAALSSHGTVYAAGTANTTRGQTSLLLLPVRELRPGRYTLALITGRGPHERIRREAFTLS